MPVMWDIALERKLLVAMFEVSNPKPPSWPTVAAMMGEGVTPEACRQHYMKIKRESAKAAAGESLPATPTKSNSRKTKSLASPKNSPKRKVEDVDDESESGTKRVTITKGHQTDRKVQEAPKSKKPKKPKKEHEEHPGLAEFFKMEEIGSSAYNVDEGDELYESVVEQE